MRADLGKMQKSRKRRAKVKGRRPDGPFIGMPRHLLDSPEFGELSAHATKLVLELAREYRGNNNGDFSASYQQLKKRGWHSPGTLDRAKKELVERGFAIVTRQGGRHRCSLFALTWWPIDDCNGKHDEPPSHAPLHLWRKPKALVPPRTNVVPIRINQANVGMSASAIDPDAYESQRVC